MRDLYRKFIYMPKDEKMTDQVFVTRITLSVLTMLFSLVALCSGTYAYFTDAVSTSGSTITSATYDLTIKSEKGTVTGEYTCIGAADHIYTFTLKAEGTATTGYCKVTIDGENDSPYFTHQIDKGTQLTLKIKAADGTKIKFEPSWGTSAVSAGGGNTYGVDKIIVCVNAVNLTAESVDDTETTTSTTAETTTSVESETTTTIGSTETTHTETTHTETTTTSEHTETKSTTAAETTQSVTEPSTNGAVAPTAPLPALTEAATVPTDIID